MARLWRPIVDTWIDRVWFDPLVAVAMALFAMRNEPFLLASRDDREFAVALLADIATGMLAIAIVAVTLFLVLVSAEDAASLQQRAGPALHRQLIWTTAIMATCLASLVPLGLIDYGADTASLLVSLVSTLLILSFLRLGWIFAHVLMGLHERNLAQRPRNAADLWEPPTLSETDYVRDADTNK